MPAHILALPYSPMLLLTKASFLSVTGIPSQKWGIHIRSDCIPLWVRKHYEEIRKILSVRNCRR